MAAIQLNGVSFTPSDIQETISIIGTPIEARNGARRVMRRASKRTWRITWSSVPASDRTAIRNVTALTSSFTYQDQDGNTATVFCKDDAFQDSVAEIATESGAQALYYDVDLTIYEA